MVNFYRHKEEETYVIYINSKYYALREHSKHFIEYKTFMQSNIRKDFKVIHPPKQIISMLQKGDNESILLGTFLLRNYYRLKGDEEE